LGLNPPDGEALVKFTKNCFKEFSFPENAISSKRVTLKASYLSGKVTREVGGWVKAFGK